MGKREGGLRCGGLERECQEGEFLFSLYGLLISLKGGKADNNKQGSQWAV